MGGLAVAVDWSERPDPSAFASMVEAMGHRGRAGIRTANAGAALLAEARLPRDGTEGWRIATAGPLTLVGDLRLWHLDALRSMAGIDDADPRMLALHAWAAHGAAMMDAVDGDFAFAIWDADTSTLFAARDRFGAKPLWIQQTPSGIRLASGTGQLVAATDPRPGPDPVTVERFLRDEVAYDDRSFHYGIRRLMPAHHLVATADGVTTTRYWDPSEIPERPAADVPATFRRLVVDAVADRLAESQRTVSDLSGGLDSSSITAAAHDLVPDRLDAGRFVTVSAIVPGTETDESPWIAATVATQPFAHRDHTVGIGDIDDYAADMATTGMPVAHHIRDLAVRTAAIAVEEGADLVLTGNGGDEVADDRWVFAHLLRAGRLWPWGRAVASMGAQSPYAAALWAASSVGQALPPRVRRAIRGQWRRSDTEGADDSEGRPDVGMRHHVASRLHTGRGLLVLEWLEAMYAASGIEVSHPYLDRRIVEFVASLPATALPVGVANKALIREAFRGALPDTVVDRQEKVTGNEHIDRVVATHGPALIERFPAVPDRAAPFIDPDRYRDEVARFRANDADAAGSLWPVWSVMLWLDGAP